MSSRIYFNEESRQFSVIEDREFGVKSKILAILSPGAWHAKEANKYAYDTEDEYKKNRWKNTLKAHLTPLTAAHVHHKARRMHAEGKSAEEIRDYIKKSSHKRRLAGVGEVTLRSLGSGITDIQSAIQGIFDARHRDRKKFNKK